MSDGFSRGNFLRSSLLDLIVKKLELFRKKGQVLLAAILFFTVAFSGSAHSAPDPGVSLPDDKTGYQIQLVYVDTQSSIGSDYDKTGDIEEWVSQLQSWLKNKIGKQLIFDTYQGKLDIAYLKFNGNITRSNDQALVKKYRALNPSTFYGKTLAFVVDQTAFDGDACGWAGMPSDNAFIFPNFKDCSGYDELTSTNNGFSFVAQSLLHEIIHSYGVDHVCVNNTDLMQGSPECENAGVEADYSKPVTFDVSGKYYFGGNRSGMDLKTLRVWSDGSGSKRPDLDQEMCWSGQECEVSFLTYPTQATFQLQLKSGSKWKAVGNVNGKLSNCQGCDKYSFRNLHTFSKPGMYQYRIVVLATKNFSAYIGKPSNLKVM